jgi:hypothetical protein
MKIERNTICFSTGKQFYAYSGVIGLDDGLIKTGYDDSISQGDLTNEELYELAEYMIKRWQDFKENLS